VAIAALGMEGSRVDHGTANLLRRYGTPFAQLLA
jgi:hypothetical protein